MDPSRGDSRYNLNYSMGTIGLTLADQTDIYGNPTSVAVLSGRPPSAGLLQSMSGSATSIGLGPRNSGIMSATGQCQTVTNNAGGQQNQQRGLKRAGSDCYEDHHRAGGGNPGSSTGMSSLQALESCSASAQHANQPQQSTRQQSASGSGAPDLTDDVYNPLQNKKSPPANGKKTKGRVKIKMEYIDNKLRRYTTFSKRKTGIMKKAYELSTLTGTQVMLLVASETGHVYTFATRKLQPMITSEAGKQLIQTCLNSPDPPSAGGGDQRMSATGFEETELSYNIADEDSKDDRSPLSSGNETEDSSEFEFQTTTENDKSLGNNISRKQDGIAQSNNSEECINKMSQKHTSNETKGGTKVSNNTFSFSDIAKPSNNTDRRENVVYPPSLLSNVPQDVLLQLIQSGHLQVYTEEDGSGHQYVAIPLSPTTMNLLQTSKPTGELAEKRLESSKCSSSQRIKCKEPSVPETVVIKREGE